MPGTYRSLDAWRFADELFFEIHKLAMTFPSDERFVLTPQLRRSALSVPTNIVEGTARFNPRERVQLLRTAWASLAEVEYLLSVADRLGYVPGEQPPALNALVAKTAGALRGLIAKIDPSAIRSRPEQRRA
jgi:four helix bundle protein